MLNIHIHTFKSQDVPVGFLPLGLVPILNTKVGYFLFSRILTDLNPFSSKDKFERYLTFIKIGKKNSQEEILGLCAENYPCDTQFCILLMDMSQMEAGRVPRNYIDQITEIVNLKAKNPNALPFVHIDPRREDYMSIFNYAMSEKFHGLKLYPPLGVFPFDIRFDPIYEYCQANGKPVMAHCTAGNPVYFKGSRKELKVLLKESKMEVDYSLSNKDLCAYFTHPSNYKYVFEKFPKLKVCLAHFGRENEWDKIIRDMMKIYPYLYTDISYSLYDPQHWGYLKVLLSTDEVLRERVMFGSDFYMVEIDSDEKQFSLNLRGYLGEELWKQIAEINPRNYLNIHQ